MSNRSVLPTTFLLHFCWAGIVLSAVTQGFVHIRLPVTDALLESAEVGEQPYFMINLRESYDYHLSVSNLNIQTNKSEQTLQLFI